MLEISQSYILSFAENLCGSQGLPRLAQIPATGGHYAQAKTITNHNDL